MDQTTVVEQKALTVIDQAKMVKIVDAETYKEAGALWKSIEAMKKEVFETFDPIVRKAHAAWKEAIAQKDKYYAPLDEAHRAVKKLMSDYDLEQERLRLAEQRRLEEELRKQEEDRKLQEALDAEASGQKEEAAAILEEPVTAPPIILAKTTPKVAGGPVYRTVWKFKIENAALIPREYLVPDEVKIGGVIRASKGMIKIPGVRAYEDRV